MVFQKKCVFISSQACCSLFLLRKGITPGLLLLLWHFDGQFNWWQNLQFGFGFLVEDLVLWLNNGNIVGQWLLGSNLAIRVIWQHNLYLNAQHSLSQENVTCGRIDVIMDWITGMDHQTVNELHALRTLATQFTGHNDFATLGSRFHDEPQHSVACTTNGQSSGQLVTQTFGLSDGAQSTGGNLFSVQFDGTSGEIESV